MDPNDRAGLSRRARRGIALIGAALGIGVVAGLPYLRPALDIASPPPYKPPPYPPLLDSTHWVAYQFVTPTLGWALVAQLSNQHDQSPFWIFQTSDGARHWQIQLTGLRGVSPIAFRIQFFNQASGFAFAGREATYRTTDGGTHWNQVALPAYEPGEVTFSDPIHGWFLGWSSAPVPGGQRPHFYHTFDGGKTWTGLPALPPSSNGSMDLRGFEFRRPGDGWREP